MSRGTAGLIFAFSNLVQVAGAFLIPLAAGRMTTQRPLVLLVVACNVIGIVGLIAAPVAGAWVWATLLGIAQGGEVSTAMEAASFSFTSDAWSGEISSLGAGPSCSRVCGILPQASR